MKFETNSFSTNFIIWKQAKLINIPRKIKLSSPKDIIFWSFWETWLQRVF